MDCQEIERLLARYLDDDLGAEDRLAMEEHLARCYTCGEELADLRAVLAACDRVLTPPPLKHRFEDLIPHLHTQPPVVQTKRSVWRDVFRTAAAAAMVLLMVGTVDAAVGGMRHVFRTTERALREAPKPNEAGQGLLGWRERIAWAEVACQITEPKEEEKTAEKPEPQKPENTTGLPSRDNRMGVRFADNGDRNGEFRPFVG